MALRNVGVADEVWSQVATDDTRERLNALNDCLEKLNTRAKYAISLRYHHNRLREVMAKALNMTSHGDKTLLHHTRVVLCQCLKKR